MKRIAALAVAVLLLSGCSIPVLKYPYLPPESLATQTIALRLVLPEDADELLQNAMTTLEAKALELSGGKIQLSSVTPKDMSASYQDGKAGLYLLNSKQVAALDAQLAFAGMPFLFGDPDKLLAILNDQEGFVSTSPVVRSRLQGTVLGVYYRAPTLLLNANKHYEELGLYGGAGVLDQLGASAGFTGLGVESQQEGSQEELLAAFADGTVKLCEILPNTVIPPKALAEVKSIELTNHRFDCWWLILRGSDTMDGQTVNILREAFAYTRQQYDDGRAVQCAEEMERFWQQYSELIQERNGFAVGRKQARAYYLDNWAAMGIPEEIWYKLSELL
ncbi:MAG: hypothetical protein RR022_08080 [Angelakisella sp.]